MVTGVDAGFDLAPFRLARFDGWNAATAPVTLHG
jgi:hypothetical protein